MTMNFLNAISIVCVAVVLTLFTPRNQHRESARIVPKQMRAEFSQGTSAKAWTDDLYSPSNEKLYVLSLEPEVDAGKHVIGIDLVLRSPEKLKTDENLLTPAGNWHGLQPYNFVASDLLHGGVGSEFGARRSIKVASRRLKVVIQILDVKFRTSPDGTQVIADLKLSVSVDNLPDSP